MPALEQVHDAFENNGIKVLAVHNGPTIAQAREFAERHGLDLPIAVDEALSLTDWRVSGLPTTCLMDDQGIVRYEAQGVREWDAPVVLEEIRRYTRKRAIELLQVGRRETGVGRR